MQENFEAATSTLIKLDLYRRSNRVSGVPRAANISSIDFSTGRGNTGVDLRWYLYKEFNKLADNQKKELRDWMSSQDGKKAIRKSSANFIKKRNSENNDKSQHRNWKKKMKKALKTSHRLKSVMSVLAEEKKSNKGLAVVLNSNTNLPPPPTPVAHPLSVTPLATGQASSL